MVIGNGAMGGSTKVTANALSNSGTININGNTTAASNDQATLDIAAPAPASFTGPSICQVTRCWSMAAARSTPLRPAPACRSAGRVRHRTVSFDDAMARSPRVGHGRWRGVVGKSFPLTCPGTAKTGLHPIPAAVHTLRERPFVEHPAWR
jgi:hypothetical protein